MSRKPFKVIKGGLVDDKYRNQELAKIHVLANKQGLDDATYRAMLMSLTGCNSSAKLNVTQRRAVIAHLNQGQVYEGKPRTTAKNAQLQKIEALLSEQKKPWSYAHGIAKQMYGKDDLTFCTPQQLRGVITALVKVGQV